MDYLSLPYRPNVGIVVVNKAGLVFTGRRKGKGGHGNWQLPQGGIDPGEDVVEAAKRELFEETSITSVEFLQKSSETIKYDLPETWVRTAWEGKYRGQEQTWVKFLFIGEDSEINVNTPGNGQPQEFSEWRWQELLTVTEIASPMKRTVYKRVVEMFAS